MDGWIVHILYILERVDKRKGRFLIICPFTSWICNGKERELFWKKKSGPDFLYFIATDLKYVAIKIGVGGGPKKWTIDKKVSTCFFIRSLSLNYSFYIIAFFLFDFFVHGLPSTSHSILNCLDFLSESWVKYNCFTVNAQMHDCTTY